MFKRPTVFVLGAGASWHYGYPTGEGLVSRVRQKADELANYFRRSIRFANPNIPGFVTRSVDMSTGLSSGDNQKLWNDAWLEAAALSQRLSAANPTVIDYFLAQNSDLHAIGKLAIAMVLFDCEARYRERGGNPNRQEAFARKVEQGMAPRSAGLDVCAFNDDWIRFVLYKLTSQCQRSADLLNNQVTFVTYNYDPSLEYRLFNGLRAISLFDGPDINSFLSDGHILHVYGQVRERFDDGMPIISTALPDPHPADPNTLEDVRQRLNLIYVASKDIHTINGEDKEWNRDRLELARNAIREAEVAYVLGYGFDQLNSERVGLSLLRENVPRNRTVMFTNYGGHNRVSKAASKAMIPANEREEAFIPPAPPLTKCKRYVDGTHRMYTYEMSTKNVYDAFEQDFESLETD